MHTYNINGTNLCAVDSFADLGVRRTASGDYAGHCATVASKASKMSGAIRRAFHIKPRELMWPVFQRYILPILMYGSQAWNPVLKRDVRILEGVQQRYTKTIWGMKDMSYAERLRAFNALSVANMRCYADMVFIYKCVHKLANISSADVGLVPLTSKTRGCGYRLKQSRPYNKTYGNLFQYRAVSQWNKLPINIVSSKSIKLFKTALYQHLFANQL